MKKYKIAVLDDHQSVALESADWSVLYLVGHLIATHDRMFPLLDLGERLHPELDETVHHETGQIACRPSSDT
jgi:hypothetical protein